MGCREKTEVGGDGWVDGRIRGIARQTFRTRILPCATPTRCPSRMHTYEPTHMLPRVCVRVLAIFDGRKIQEKLPHFSDFPVRGLWLSSIAPLVNLTQDIKNTAKRHVSLRRPRPKVALE